jgi:hypothetical protein
MPRIRLKVTPRRVAVQLIDWMHEPAKTRGPYPQRAILRRMREAIDREVSSSLRDALEAVDFQHHVLREKPDLDRLKAEAYRSAERQTVSSINLYNNAFCDFLNLLSKELQLTALVLTSAHASKSQLSWLLSNFRSALLAVAVRQAVLHRIEKYLLGAPVLPAYVDEIPTLLENIAATVIRRVSRESFNSQEFLNSKDCAAASAQMLSSLRLLSDGRSSWIEFYVQSARNLESEHNLFCRLDEFSEHLAMLIKSQHFSKTFRPSGRSSQTSGFESTLESLHGRLVQSINARKVSASIRETALTVSESDRNSEARHPFDSSMPQQLRALGKQAAEDLGMFGEKVLVEWDGNLTLLTEDQLNRMLESLAKVAEEEEREKQRSGSRCPNVLAEPGA